uniref:Uncharacterized protein n=1 Tax=Romanomermis culicivorax TaxID=13658 RepID=A0A915KMC1_ROMCU
MRLGTLKTLFQMKKTAMHVDIFSQLVCEKGAREFCHGFCLIDSPILLRFDMIDATGEVSANAALLEIRKSISIMLKRLKRMIIKDT